MQDVAALIFSPTFTFISNIIMPIRRHGFDICHYPAKMENSPPATRVNATMSIPALRISPSPASSLRSDEVTPRLYHPTTALLTACVSSTSCGILSDLNSTKVPP